MEQNQNRTNTLWEKDRRPLHPLWLAFIGFCEELRFGEIERLKIQDGLPMSAEEVKKKIKFSPVGK